MAKPNPNPQGKPSEAKKFLEETSKEGAKKSDEQEKASADKEVVKEQPKPPEAPKASEEVKKEQAEPKKDKFAEVPRKFHKFIK